MERTPGHRPERIHAAAPRGGTDDIPPVPRIDPSSALLRDPQVPERDRYCRHGGTPHPVGRGREGRPGLLRGFCPQDGTPYSFAPPLAEGSLVAGQYEVRGALAHGGLGWIYLAVDRNVDDRWVVLKGVLDANDPAALAAARAERQFLAQLSHPNIVAIHNFVRHVDDHGVAADYIVMAYIGGSTLAQVRDARGRRTASLPVAHALTYMIKVLPALGYLHAEGHVYSDFKPDNVMQCERHLTLIDMGAVARIDDADAVVYGTVGYHAPEVVRAELSPASDLYTVGRTLAVLALGIEPARGGVATELPDDHPLLRRHESLHRLLLRATHPDPRYRFGSADEMAEQLDGVRREVRAVDEQRPRPGPSGGLLRAPGHVRRGPAARPLRPGRPAPAQVADRLPNRSTPGTASTPDAGPDDWRHRWSAALAALAGGDLDTARAAFDAMYSTFPGELAPKLALAAVAECAGGRRASRSATTSWSRRRPELGRRRLRARPHPAACRAAGRRRGRAARGARRAPAVTSPRDARPSRRPCSATTPGRPTTTSCARPRRCWSGSTWTR